jgi:LacI family transcriptional regulator
MKRPTQKDVALKAGVSRSTVSYVLNDQTQLKIPISDETRQRVMEAIVELGYEPDARAQSLRLGHTNIVGVRIKDPQRRHEREATAADRADLFARFFSKFGFEFGLGH